MRYKREMKHKMNTELNKSKSKKSDFNFEQILEKNQLSYDDLDFNDHQLDTLRSYSSLKTKVHKRSNIIRNVKSILPLLPIQRILKPVYTIALTTIVILTVILLREHTNPVQFAEISVDAGEKITLHITDNITVWLNSGSTIKIPMEMKRNSKIYLEGEAYFEINKAYGKNIEIISDNISFSTNKASFNINKDNNQIIAHVKQGNLKLYNQDLPKSTTLNLEENDKAVCNSLLEFISVENENTMNYLAWHTGVITFNQTPMNKVVESISDIYNIPVIITNQKIINSTFSAEFNNANIDQILDKIELAFNCEIATDGNKLIIN
jgi:ferric-dicitrate binding protein FerR (iron transport regulator)